MEPVRTYPVPPFTSFVLGARLLVKYRAGYDTDVRPGIASSVPAVEQAGELTGQLAVIAQVFHNSPDDLGDLRPVRLPLFVDEIAADWWLDQHPAASAVAFWPAGGPR